MDSYIDPKDIVKWYVQNGDVEGIVNYINSTSYSEREEVFKVLQETRDKDLMKKVKAALSGGEVQEEHKQFAGSGDIFSEEKRTDRVRVVKSLEGMTKDGIFMIINDIPYMSVHQQANLYMDIQYLLNEARRSNDSAKVEMAQSILTKLNTYAGSEMLGTVKAIRKAMKAARNPAPVQEEPGMKPDPAIDRLLLAISKGQVSIVTEGSVDALMVEYCSTPSPERKMQVLAAFEALLSLPDIPDPKTSSIVERLAAMEERDPKVKALKDKLVENFLPANQARKAEALINVISSSMKHELRESDLHLLQREYNRRVYSEGKAEVLTALFLYLVHGQAPMEKKEQALSAIASMVKEEKDPYLRKLTLDAVLAMERSMLVEVNEALMGRVVKTIDPSLFQMEGITGKRPKPPRTSDSAAAAKMSALYKMREKAVKEASNPLNDIKGFHKPAQQPAQANQQKRKI